MTELLIVGAGPAGLAAAISAAEQGLRVTVVDEFPRAGGRLLGQLYQEPDGTWWNGIEISRDLYRKAESYGVDIRCGVSVFDIASEDSGWTIHTSKGIFSTEKLLLATGSSETPLPIPGWTTPGVMSVGAAQVMTNVHRVRAGDSCVIIGINVLSMAIAQELIQCGIQVKGMYLPVKNMATGSEGEPVRALESMMRLSHLAPSALLRKAGNVGKRVSPNLSIRFFPSSGMKVTGIPMKLKTAAVEIERAEDGLSVKTVNVRADGTPIIGSNRSVEADFVCIAGGLAPMAELASLAGCVFRYVPELGGHVPLHNERMQTTVRGLYVAGNITGVESAKVAIRQGTVAGLAAALDLKGPDSRLEQAIRQAEEKVSATRAGALIQFNPGIEKARKMLYEDWIDQATVVQ